MDLSRLNDQQVKAIKTVDGPILIVAGAGSGKTTVLTNRVAYLIDEVGVDPESILAITFTNKAAKEMKDRMISMLGPLAYKIQISTFHSFGLLILKEYGNLLGFDKNFTIIDSDDSLTIIKKILKEENLDPKQYNPKTIKSMISGAKNELMDSSTYERYAATDFDKIVLKVYEKYQNKLIRSNSLDFDDLLKLPIDLFKSNSDVLKKYQDRFKYILIDEYQDTNEAQYILSKLIASKYKNICVVGDSDQSIYSWRGANYKNILNFEKDYKNANIIMLEENYRSTKNILNAANDVIKNNKIRKEKNLWTQNDLGKKIKYHRCYDEKEEAEYVTKEIQNQIKNGVPKDEIAVLYRTNAQSRLMEEYLLRENIPYRVVGSFYFYNRKEIKDLIAYLKLIHNVRDDISLQRILNVPKRGIGEKTIEKILSKANLENASMFEAIDSGKELEFKNMVFDLIEYELNHSLTELIDYVLNKTGIKQELENEKTLEAEVRLENLEEFKSITRSFEEKNGIISLEEFLYEISLVSDIEEHKDGSDLITLMTVHSAKGLEFDTVFIIGLEEGVFPHKNSFFESEQLEEERRLCYVAITRARKELYLVNARKRLLYGMDYVNQPSRFINEINEELLDKDNEKTVNKINFNNSVDKSIEYKIGDHIVHDKFGSGVIITVEDRILTVAFPHPHGIQKLIKGHKSIRKE